MWSFKPKPKPLTHEAVCIECGKTVQTTLPGTEVIHLMCEIKRDDREKAKRQRIDEIKQALREYFSETKTD